ncbi:MAG: PilZ domain-containing protein [Planctomycetia bacterium]|nr:PilZ domain-containing protein [Planctomycetia bacterium]
MNPAASQPVERRHWPRRHQRLRVLLLDQHEEVQEPLAAWVLDRSGGGLRLAVDREIRVGATLAAKPTSAPARSPWVEVTVRRCRHTNDGYELGCQFVGTPSLMSLLLFG